MNFKKPFNIFLLIFYLNFIFQLVNSYSIYLPKKYNYVTSEIINVALDHHSTHKYIYSLEVVDPHNSLIKLNSSRWIDLNPQTGQIVLKEKLKCSGSKLKTLTPRPLKLIIQALQYSLIGPTPRTVQFLRFPLEIYFEHSSCEPLVNNFYDSSNQLENQISNSKYFNKFQECNICKNNFKDLVLTTENLALIQQINNHDSSKNCFHYSQFLTNLNQLTPSAFRQQCKLKFEVLNQPLIDYDFQVENEKLVFEKNSNELNTFKIQHHLNDLVVSNSHCQDKDIFNLSLVLMLNCDHKNFEKNSILLSSKQLIDVTLSKSNNIQLNVQNLNQFIHKRNLEMNKHKMRLESHLNKIKNNVYFVLDDNFLNKDEKNQRSKRELKANRQMSNPYFDRNLYIVNVPEEQDKGYIVTTLTAKNQNPNQQIVYSMNAILDARSQSMFKIDESTGLITTTVKLDREFMDVHYFKVFAAELYSNNLVSENIHNQTVQKSAQITLQINVMDINDNSPIFEKLNYETTISESQPINTVIGTVRATDLDVGPNAELEYSINQINVCNGANIQTENKINKEFKNSFKINAKSGVVSTNVYLDRETNNCYEITIQVNDLAQPGLRKTSETSMIVKISDENDNYPQFLNRSYSVSIREDINYNEKPLVIQIKATDDDDNLNSVLRYSIISGNQLNHFSINSLNGEIYVVKQLDYEQLRSYRLIIRAQDTGSPPKSNTTQLLINLLDVNDNAPVFYNSLIQETVPENTKENENILKIQAFDADDGDNAKIFYAIKYNEAVIDENIYFNLYNQLMKKNKNENYKMVNETIFSNSKIILPFRIDNETGLVYTTKQLDYEEQSVFEFNVIARDFGIPFKEASTQVIIRVEDINDNNPVFLKKNYEITISELTKVGTELLKLSATDLDEKSRLFYTLINGNNDNKFNLINKQMTNEAILTLMSKLDYKVAKNYQLTVQVSDSGARTDFCTVSINITDANTHRPVIEKIMPNNIPIQLSEDLAINSLLAIVEASDDDTGENARLTFSILNNNGVSSSSSNNQINDLQNDEKNQLNISRSNEFPFKIDANTGVITLTRKLDRELVSGYSFIINVMDNGNPPLSDTVNLEFEILDVNDNRPQFEKSLYNVTINELVSVGTSFLTIKATDIDQGINSQIRYNLVDASSEFIGHSKLPFSSNYSSSFIQNNYNFNFMNNNNQQLNQHFSIDPVSGVIRTNKLLDRETQPVYYLMIQAIDKGQPQLSNTTLVIVHLEDANDNPPRFNTEKFVFYIAENSPLNSIVGKIKAEDADEGINAVINYEIVPGLDGNLFKLVERKQENSCELLTNTELDFESSKKVYNLVIRACSLPLRNDVEIEIFVLDVNDNIPRINDFTIVFNNYKNHFPLSVIGKAPGYDIDVNDNLKYRFVSGNKANLILLNETTGDITLSPYLNTNVPTKAQFEIAITDGLNEASALMNLVVNLVTEKMLQNSVTLRLSSISQNDFLNSVYNRFLDGLSMVIQCNRDNIVIFNIQEDLESSNLNVSFSIRLDDDYDIFFAPNILKERIYLKKFILSDTIGYKILPFDDNICVYEPCINFEQCNVVSKFKSADNFIHAKNFLFRPVITVDTFTCSCPEGYTGFSFRLDCDTELNLCHSSPCLNNGKCIQEENGYSCNCEAGFTGSNCEFNLEENLDDICDQSELCKSGSKCLSLAQKRSVNKRQSEAFIQKHNSDSKNFSIVMSSETEIFSSKLVNRLNTKNPSISSIDNLYCLNCTNSEWSNEFCELKSRSFTKGSYITFNTIKNRHRFHISLEFASVFSHGLLFYNGRFNEQNDFISLQYKENQLIFSYSTGSNTNEVIIKTTNNYLSNGEWHKVEINYYNRTVLMKLDDCNDALLKKHLKTLNYHKSINPFNLKSYEINGFPFGSSEYLQFTCSNFNNLAIDELCSDKFVNCNRFLDLNGPLQLGGLPTFESKSQSIVNQFEGCISNFYINHKLLDMNSYVSNNGAKIGCDSKKKFCNSNTCKNNGKCREIWNDYVCNCKNGFTGKNCKDLETSHIRSFKSTNSYLSFSPNLLPINSPWKFQFSFKTTQQECFLMQIQLGLSSQIALFLSNGTLNLLLNNKNYQVSSLDFSNGDWNNLETTWSSSSLSLNFNYGELALTKQHSTDLRGLIVTKVNIAKFEEITFSNTSSSEDNSNGLIMVNELEDSNDFSNKNLVSNKFLSSLPNFNGCIQTLDINGNKDGWLNPTEFNNIENNCNFEDPCLKNTCPSKENSLCVNQDLGQYKCKCKSNQFYGKNCESICNLNPCENQGKCVLNSRSVSGYNCICPHNYTGFNCETKVINEITCPLNWWKNSDQSSCIPCGCDIKLGLNSACNKLNGQCECEKNHFKLDLKETFKKFLIKYVRNIKTDTSTKLNYNKVGKTKFENEQLLKAYLKSDDFNENSFSEIDYNSPLTKLVELLVNNEVFRKNLVRSVYSNIDHSNLDKNSADNDDNSFELVLNDFIFNDNLFNHFLRQKMDISKMTKVCMDCSCNSLGSYSSNCSEKTGKCMCKPGVIGKKCDQCSSSLAEITKNGCEVIYNGCPSQLNERIWWPKTKFNQLITMNCPINSFGQANRYCSDEFGWLEPDLFSCISNEFKDLAEQLSILEKNNLPLTTYLSIKITSELKNAITSNKILYGGDVLISAKLIHYVISNELKQTGLNLTHKQDQNFLQNLITIVSEVFNSKYEKHWEKINKLELLKNEIIIEEKKNSKKVLDFQNLSEDKSQINEEYVNDDPNNYIDNRNELVKKVMKLNFDNINHQLSLSINAEKMLNILIKYSTVLLLNQEDTFTSPFQIATNNILYSMDTVSTDELWNLNEINYLINKSNLSNKKSIKNVFKREIDLSSFDQIKDKFTTSSFLNKVENEFCVQFPKFNNFMKQSSISLENNLRVTKDKLTKIYIPLSTLKVKNINQFYEELEYTKQRKEIKKTVVVYSIYSSVGKFLQMNFDHSIKSRFGVPIKVNSPLISLQIKPSINDYPQKLNSNKVHFVFKILQQNSYSNPQCAHLDLIGNNQVINKNQFQMTNGFLFNQTNNISYDLENLSAIKGVWSTKGCKLTGVYPQQTFTNVITYVNCTCDRGHIFAVLMDKSENKFYFEVSSLLKTITSSVNLISLSLLLITIGSLFIAFKGVHQTNCNSIHRNVSICAFCCNILFAVSSIWRNNLLQFEFQCKMMAILLQYFYLSSFCWLLVCSTHLQRILSELRDINKGPMHFYNLIGHALPAVITAVSLAMRADQYGNYLFCWLSVHEAVFWSMFGPIILLSTLSIINFILALRSSLQIKHSIADYRSLNTVIWLNIIWFFLLSINCFLAIFASNNTSETPFYLVNLSFLVNSIYLFTGYCLMNSRVRFIFRTLIHRIQNKSLSNESLNQTKTSVLMHNSKSYLSQTLSSPTTSKPMDFVDQPFNSILKTPYSNSQQQIAAKFKKSSIDFGSNFDSSTTTTSHSNFSKRHHKKRQNRSNKNLMSGLNDSVDNYIDPYGNIDYDNDDDYEYNQNGDSRQSYILDRRNHSSNYQIPNQRILRKKKSLQKIYSDIDIKTKHYDNIDNYNVYKSNQYLDEENLNKIEASSGYANTQLSPTSVLPETTIQSSNYDIYQMPSQLFSNLPPYGRNFDQNIYSNSAEVEAQKMNALNQEGFVTFNNNTNATQPFNRSNIFAMLNPNENETYQENTLANNYSEMDNNIETARLKLVNYSINADEENEDNQNYQTQNNFNENVEI